MTTSSNWLFNFILAFVTPYMVDSGPGNANLGVKVFFIWTAFCVLAVVFVWALIYETKGLALEEVDVLYTKVSKAWQSPRFRKTAGRGHLELDTVAEDKDSAHHVEIRAGGIEKV